ncbi:MAG TPA: hypothetical protein VK978_03680 [Candidatus Saccharimonadales bacterium]|nr:hypothetical protein [Candidatus Saccharimonadales bacterium]
MYTPLRALDNLLNRITMYALTQWGLRVLATMAILLAFTGALAQPWTGLLYSLLILSASVFTANVVFSKLFKVPVNAESFAITLLILFFILPPATTVERAVLLAMAGVLAIASKFLITWNDKHIFNPAAFAPVVLGTLGLLGASWWVGSAVLWPLVLVLGLLIVRKIRRFSVFLPFAAVSLLVIAATTFAEAGDVGEALRATITASPLLFLGTIMLTEPSTMPGRRHQQIIFGALVGFLYAMPWDGKLFPLHIYPETALLLGNLYAFAVNPRYRLRLTLKSVEKVSDRVYNYVFTPDRQPDFLPGQYMEWTLPGVGMNLRGNRRTLSIASSPTEPAVMTGVKFYTPSSSYKKVLKDLKPGSVVYAGQIAGDFVLPADTSLKLLFVAAGIGVTPFRSMLKYVLDAREQRDIVLIYAVSDASEIAYADVLAAAEQQGIKVLRLLTARGDAPKDWQGSTGSLNAAFITAQVSDYKDRLAYLSGPNGMVQDVRADLIRTGVSAAKVKTDYFTGY